MKPSAQRMTWIEEVSALRGLRRDVEAWLEGEASPIVALVAGASMLHGDWRELQYAIGHDLIDLSADVRMQRQNCPDEVTSVRASARLLQETADRFYAAVQEGSELITAVLAAERAAYALGAQDVRMRVARRPWGQPLPLPDKPSDFHGPLPVMMAVRRSGYWATGAFVVGDLGDTAAALGIKLKHSENCVAYDNRVAFPETKGALSGLVEVSAEANRARWTALCLKDGAGRDWLFWPPGLSVHL